MPQDRKTTPFRFKQFTVEQNRAAMKVGFDGILLGAWANVDGCQRILDVGTGTGLIALMLAQRTQTEEGSVHVDAIEIDSVSVDEATVNVSNSPWSDRVHVIHKSLQDFARTNSVRYDLVVCNPPFFEDGTLSQDRSRWRARHANTLTFANLCDTATEVVSGNGRLCVVLPSRRAAACIEFAREVAWFCRRRLRVKPTPNKPAHRVLLEFQRSDRRMLDDELTLELRRHEYSDEYRELAKDFYLTF
jgi:tRNA1Val (adenine37-N6)-methyltransferase